MNQLNPNQAPLGSKFKSYELTRATNYYTLDPFQYSITKFDFNGTSSKNETFYKGIELEKLIPSYTSVKKSVNDFSAQSYHRFTANEGYFNPQEGNNNSDLWFYGSNGGPALNVQDVNHIIFPEAQRGGLDSKNLTKYSWTSEFSKPSESWEAQNKMPVDNSKNCEFFNYNNEKVIDFNQVYSFDSDYCRSIGISSPNESRVLN